MGTEGRCWAEAGPLHGTRAAFCYARHAISRLTALERVTAGKTETYMAAPKLITRQARSSAEVCPASTPWPVSHCRAPEEKSRAQFPLACSSVSHLACHRSLSPARCFASCGWCLMGGGREGDARLDALAESEENVDGPGTRGAAPESDLRLVRVLLERGHVDAAHARSGQLRAAHPDHPHCAFLEGLCCEGAQDIPAAMGCYAAALAMDSRHEPALLRCAAISRASGHLEQAREWLLRAKDCESHSPEWCKALAEVLTDLATAKLTAGGVEVAEAMYREALTVDGACAAAEYNLGVVSSSRGDAEAAVRHYERALELRPDYLEALSNLGVLVRAQGDTARARQLFDRAYRLAPSHDVVRENLASLLTALGAQEMASGSPADAEAYLDHALAVHSKHVPALYNLGVLHAARGRLHRAVFCYEAAVALSEGHAEAWNNLGVVFKDLGLTESAVACYRRAIAANPSFPQSLNNLGVVLISQGGMQKGRDALQAALQVDAGYAEAHNNMGILLKDVGRARDALDSYDRCLALEPSNRKAAQNRLLGLNYVHPGEDPLVSREHEAWGVKFQAGFQVLSKASPEAREGRALRVGYVSPDLFTHSVSYFAEVPLTGHDKDRFLAVVYNCTPREDDKTKYLRERVTAAGHVWRDVASLTEAELAVMAREDRLDILVDLTGHTANNRLGTLAMRPAPVQVTWIGYPNSTGLQAVDYRLTDAVADPPDTTQSFVETLVRLPGCFLCYAPPRQAPDVAPLPAAANGFVTFGSFNNLAKVTEEVLALWGRVLAAVPGSRLLLKGKPFVCAVARREYQAVLRNAGLDPGRVDLIPMRASNADHLAAYGLVDIGLDPFPYAGTTTTVEAMFMGVAVLTLRGQCHAQNVGASLMEAVGGDLPAKWAVASQAGSVSRGPSGNGDDEGGGSVCDLGCQWPVSLHEQHWVNVVTGCDPTDHVASTGRVCTACQGNGGEHRPPGIPASVPAAAAVGVQALSGRGVHAWSGGRVRGYVGRVLATQGRTSTADRRGVGRRSSGVDDRRLLHLSRSFQPPPIPSPRYPLHTEAFLCNSLHLLDTFVIH